MGRESVSMVGEQISYDRDVYWEVGRKGAEKKARHAGTTLQALRPQY